MQLPAVSKGPVPVSPRAEGSAGVNHVPIKAWGLGLVCHTLFPWDAICWAVLN